MNSILIRQNESTKDDTPRTFIIPDSRITGRITTIALGLLFACVGIKTITSLATTGIGYLGFHFSILGQIFTPLALTGPIGWAVALGCLLVGAIICRLACEIQDTEDEDTGEWYGPISATNSNIEKNNICNYNGIDDYKAKIIQRGYNNVNDIMNIRPQNSAPKRRKLG